jgi:signal transduction histidine kinase
VSGSVRTRLTVAVVGVVAGLAVGAALLAPKVVRAALVDDRLDAEVTVDADALTRPYFVVTPTPTIGSAELTAYFAPEIVELVAALEPTGAIDQLRRFGHDGDLHVVVGESIVAVVPADGPIEVGLATPEAVGEPVVTIDRLRELANDLRVPAVATSPFDEMADGGMSLDQYLDDLSDDLGIDLDEYLDRQLLDELDDLVRDDQWLDDLRDQGDGGSASAAVPDDDHLYGVRRIAGVDVVVATRPAAIERSVERVRHVLWLTVPLAMLLAGGITWLLAGRALAPVAAITARTRTIRSGTLHERVPVPTARDEVAALAGEMNEMLDRVQREDVRRRQFVADASHELRSPIAAIRTQAEAALATATDDDTVELADGVLAEADRMAGLVDDLLSIARHDESLAPPGGVQDLDDLVLAEARRPRPVRVDVSAVSAGQVRGRADELTRVVTHLLDNAARHASSTVQVSLRTDDDVVVLAVDDDGPGVPIAERERVFERFVRLDDARARDAGGAGLGLAVVATVVRACGGSYHIDDSDLGGARFVVELPAVED